MTIKIFGNTPKEPVVRLALQYNVNGVGLCVVDAAGAVVVGGELLTVTEKQGIVLSPDVSNIIGIALTTDDYIAVIKEGEL